MGKELFENIPSKVADLLSDVKNGRIGLPDLQRPFVWKDNKVRELLDSMIKGYPIGYIMLWASPDDYENTGYIGKNDKMYKRPDDLVIDGQQRLTALLAAMYGVTIKDKNYKERKIRISFNPLIREFAVWTQAYERNPEWISEISSVFAADQEHNISKFRKAFIRTANEGRAKNDEHELTEDEEDIIEENINDLLNLGIYSLPTLKINSKADEEDVADIFVRVNSGGQNLTEKNFIETLIAVYDNELYDKINKFCAESRIPANGTAFNQILQVDPSHLIRMSVGVGFRRTDDYFDYSLPAELNSSSATSPAWYGYVAAINVLGTPMLFSTAPLSQYFVLGTSGDKNSVDKHHIFPKHYLVKIGYDSDRDRNQIANFTYLDYATNIDISDAPPSEYVARYRVKLGEDGYKLACAQNALPENYHELNK